MSSRHWCAAGAGQAHPPRFRGLRCSPRRADDGEPHSFSAGWSVTWLADQASEHQTVSSSRCGAVRSAPPSRLRSMGWSSRQGRRDASRHRQARLSASSAALVDDGDGPQRHQPDSTVGHRRRPPLRSSLTTARTSPPTTPTTRWFVSSSGAGCNSDGGPPPTRYDRPPSLTLVDVNRIYPTSGFLADLLTAVQSPCRVAPWMRWLRQPVLPPRFS